MHDKIIFLDIDGVLVNRRSLKERSGIKSVADENCVFSLNEIIKLTSAKIVISSAWRFCGLEEMKLILKYWGVIADVVDITPCLYDKLGNDNRALEIQKWLDDNPTKAFVIIDDIQDMSHLNKYLVRTKFEEGLRGLHINPAVDILNRSGGE